jgi:hypothetical protein
VAKIQLIQLIQAKLTPTEEQTVGWGREEEEEGEELLMACTFSGAAGGACRTLAARASTSVSLPGPGSCFLFIFYF